MVVIVISVILLNWITLLVILLFLLVKVTPPSEAFGAVFAIGNGGECYKNNTELSTTYLEPDVICASQYRTPCNLDPNDINCGGATRYQVFRNFNGLAIPQSKFTGETIQRPSVCSVLKNIAVNVITVGTNLLLSDSNLTTFYNDILINSYNKKSSVWWNTRELRFSSSIRYNIDF